MKRLKALAVFPILMFLAAYTAIPEKITVAEGQTPVFCRGITAEYGTENTGSLSCRVRLFNCIPIKTVSVSVAPAEYLIPSGEAIGVKLYTDGVLVVGMSDVLGADGRLCEPARSAGICVGDRIVAVNGEKISGTGVLSKKLDDCGGNAELTVVRGGENINIRIKAVPSSDGGYKLGLWVRDSAAGIGTMTFYDPKSASFAALGHGICDSDTGEIMTVSRGSVTKCNIVKAEIGERGIPGELTGEFTDSEIGTVSVNGTSGIYGKTAHTVSGEAVKTGARSCVKKGGAQIMCDVDGGGAKKYDIEIIRINKPLNASGKNFVIKVTDPALLAKTGGIVQGMSGSPILQDGRLIGAVTHVCVNL